MAKLQTTVAFSVFVSDGNETQREWRGSTITVAVCPGAIRRRRLRAGSLTEPPYCLPQYPRHARLARWNFASEALTRKTFGVSRRHDPAGALIGRHRWPMGCGDSPFPFLPRASVSLCLNAGLTARRLKGAGPGCWQSNVQVAMHQHSRHTYRTTTSGPPPRELDRWIDHRKRTNYCTVRIRLDVRKI